jgi:hypothetical protein
MRRGLDGRSARSPDLAPQVGHSIDPTAQLSQHTILLVHPAGLTMRPCHQSKPRSQGTSNNDEFFVGLIASASLRDFGLPGCDE